MGNQKTSLAITCDNYSLILPATSSCFLLTSWNWFRFFSFVFSVFLSLCFLLHCASSTWIISGRDLAWPFTVMTNQGPKDPQFPQGLITSLKRAIYIFSGKETNPYFCFYRLGKIPAVHKYDCWIVNLKYSRVPVCQLLSYPTRQNTRVHRSHWVVMQTEVFYL